MKFWKPQLYLWVFCTFLLLGTSTGILIGQGEADYHEAKQRQAENAESLEAAIQPTPAPTAAPIDYSILLIAVDDLSAETARMEGAWWIFHLPGSSEFQLIPLYPSITVPKLEFYMRPHAPIHIPTQSFAALKEIEVFALHKVNWKNTIIVDLQAIQTILKISHQDQDESAHKYSLPNTPTSENPKVALNIHENLLRYLCSHTKPFNSPEKIDALNTLFSDHIKTDLDPLQIFAEWNTISKTDSNIQCDYPWIE